MREVTYTARVRCQSRLAVEIRSEAGPRLHRSVLRERARPHSQSFNKITDGLEGLQNSLMSKPFYVKMARLLILPQSSLS